MPKFAGGKAPRPYGNSVTPAFSGISGHSGFPVLEWLVLVRDLSFYRCLSGRKSKDERPVMVNVPDLVIIIAVEWP